MYITVYRTDLPLVPGGPEAVHHHHHLTDGTAQQQLHTGLCGLADVGDGRRIHPAGVRPSVQSEHGPDLVPALRQFLIVLEWSELPVQLLAVPGPVPEPVVLSCLTFSLGQLSEDNGRVRAQHYVRVTSSPA